MVVLVVAELELVPLGVVEPLRHRDGSGRGRTRKESGMRLLFSHSRFALIDSVYIFRLFEGGTSVSRSIASARCPQVPPPVYGVARLEGPRGC